MNSLISVIIPTYNRADFIKETLGSILGQSYKTLEVIIVSDGGSDSTPDVIAEIDDKRIKFVQLDQNSGCPAVPRNVGLKEAKGELIAFCDDDDIWLPHKLEEQIRLFKKSPDIDLVCSNAIMFPLTSMDICIPKIKSQVFEYQKFINHKNPIINSSVLFKSELLDRVGYLDEDPDLKAVEDYDYWLRTLKSKDKSIYFDPRVQMKYRVFHEKIIEHANSEKKISQRLIKVLRKHLPDSKKRIDYLLNHAGLTSRPVESVIKKLIRKMITVYLIRRSTL